MNYFHSVGLNIIFEACHCFLTSKSGLTEKPGSIDRPIGRPNRRPDNSFRNAGCACASARALLKSNIGLEAKG